MVMFVLFLKGLWQRLYYSKNGARGKGVFEKNPLTGTLGRLYIRTVSRSDGIGRHARFRFLCRMA